MPIEVKNISHIYMENTPYEKKALNNVLKQTEIIFFARDIRSPICFYFNFTILIFYRVSGRSFNKRRIKTFGNYVFFKDYAL